MTEPAAETGPMVHMPTRLPRELAAQVRALAEQQQRTPGAMLRILVNEALNARRAAGLAAAVQRIGTALASDPQAMADGFNLAAVVLNDPPSTRE